jgi:hypothetical protein
MPQGLRTLQLAVVAVWLGASVFLTFFVGPALFSPEVLRVIPKYHAGRVAQVILGQFFWLQLACGSAAILVSLMGWAYGGTRQRPWSTLMLLGAVLVVLVAGRTLPPRMERWHAIQYAPNTTPAEKTAAQKSFRRLHGVSQVANLAVMIGVTLYFLQLTRPAQRRVLGGA